MTMLLPALCLMSCEDKVDRDVTWPEWASRPIIGTAAVSAETGSVVAGSAVNFHAEVSDEYNELSEYTLEVRYGENVVYRQNASIAGNNAVIDIDFVMPFAAYLDAGDFYPEVSLTVRNVGNGENTVRVAKENNVMVVRPETPDRLYIVDNDGTVLELSRTADEYGYSTSSENLAELGESFWIAEKVKGAAPDFSGFVWGSENGVPVIVSGDGEPIRTPDSSGYGFKSLGFDIYSFELDRLVDYTVQVDKSQMSSVDQSGVSYLAIQTVKLIRDCEVVFTGFDDLAAILQPDRFEIIDATTAKFTGHTQDWSIWYDIPDNWLIVNYAVFNTSGQLWVTGTKACFPLGNDDTENELEYLASDGKDRYASLAAVRDDAGDFSIMLYLKADFALQLYRWVKWSTTVSMESLTPDLCHITDDGIYIMPSDTFTPGVYMLKVHLTNEGNSSGDGATAQIALEYVASEL